MQSAWRTFHLSFPILAVLVAGCHQQSNEPAKPKISPAKQTIGNQLTLLELRVGNTWGFGYDVRLFPDEYVIVEDKSCEAGKREVDGKPDPKGEGICVIRVNQQQSDRFEAAMRPFRRYAIPLSSFSIEDPVRRPDGKPCREYTTDADGISLTWTGTEGSQIATFYDGCDSKEYAALYESLHHLADALPIQAVLPKY
jgi:hypothetical protein